MIGHRHRTPYQRIVRAARNGKGVHLSSRECALMAHDDAIATVATRDDCPKGYYDRACGEAGCPVHGVTE